MYIYKGKISHTVVFVCNNFLYKIYFHNSDFISSFYIKNYYKQKQQCGLFYLY